MPSVQCPIPRPLSYEDARSQYDKVRKEMPGLTPAAWRREAARRAGVDYDTFLKAWKKPGKPVTPNPTPPPVGGTPKPPPPKPPIPDPPKPPGAPGPGTAMTRAEARALDKKVAKELGLKPGTAASRKAAAERAGMRYDDFLAAWKGTPPKIPGTPRPDPIPGQPPVITKPKPPPRTPGKTEVKYDTRSISTYLTKRGWKKSKKTKERFDYRGNAYGGGTAETEGFIIRSSSYDGAIDITYRPGHLSPDQARTKVLNLIDDLRAAGFDVDSTGYGGAYRIKVTMPMRWSPEGPVRVVNHGVTMDDVMAVWDKRALGKSTRAQSITKEMHKELRKQFSYVSGPTQRQFNGVTHYRFDTHSNAPDMNEGVIAYFRGGVDRRMYLGDDVYQASFDVSHVRYEKSNWFSKCSGHAHDADVTVSVGHGARSTFAHEFGHFINDVAKYKRTEHRQMLDVMANDLGLDDMQAAKFKGSSIGDINFRKSDPALANKMARYVSRYGGTNIEEFIAEVWAEYTRAGDRARPMIKKWGTMIQDLVS